MSSHSEQVYLFGAYRLDALERLLLRNNELVPLSPKVFDTLLALVENSGHLIEKDELMKRLWPDSFVEESNLTNNISILRKAFGDGEYIQTIPKRGYRFVGDVKNPRPSRSAAQRQRRAPENRAQPDQKEPQPTSLLSPAPDRRRDVDQPETEIESNAIAILPFKCISEGDGIDRLGIATADALITRLSNIRQIVVRPTSAVLKYCGDPRDQATIARELRVDKVLNGFVQRAGDRIRVTVQLVSVREGATLWADHFDDQITDVFAMQECISRRVAEALLLTLTGEEKELPKHGTENTEAYYLYLKGRYLWWRRTGDQLEKSLNCFKAAINADPKYALAYIGLADSYASLGYYSHSCPKEVVPKAKQAALKALELDDSLAEGHTSLAYMKWCYDWDHGGAENSLKRAIELNPNYATAHQVYSFYLNTMGRFAEALYEIRLAHRLDPLQLITNLGLGLPFLFSGEYYHAIELFQRTVDMEHEFWLAHCFLGRAYAAVGEYEKAIAALQTAQRLTDTSWVLASLGHVYALAGKLPEVEEVIKELSERSRRVYVSPYFKALVYAGLGDRDLTLEWLNRAYDHRTCWLVYLRVETRFNNVRSDPRFLDLLRRLGLHVKKATRAQHALVTMT
jgi:DNA-binding winged helix-turn-helix (wHTH) protein/TolB-like protein/Tfp pilus assembly protein PilF